MFSEIFNKGVPTDLEVGRMGVRLLVKERLAHELKALIESGGNQPIDPDKFIEGIMQELRIVVKQELKDSLLSVMRMILDAEDKKKSGTK